MNRKIFLYMELGQYAIPNSYINYNSDLNSTNLSTIFGDKWSVSVTAINIWINSWSFLYVDGSKMLLYD